MYFSSSARAKRARVKPESERERKSDREVGEKKIMRLVNKHVMTGPNGDS